MHEKRGRRIIRPELKGYLIQSPKSPGPRSKLEKSGHAKDFPFNLYRQYSRKQPGRRSRSVWQDDHLDQHFASNRFFFVETAAV